MKIIQLKWNLEDEKKFASQRVVESSTPQEGRPSCVKVQNIVVYSSTAFKDVKKGAVSRVKEKRARDEGLFRRQLGRGQLWRDSE